MRDLEGGSDGGVLRKYPHLPYRSRFVVGGRAARLNHWSKADARKGFAVPWR